MNKKPNLVYKTGYIIKHINGHKIWKHPFYSREEADKEFNEQVRMIQKTRPSYRGENWKIEPFEYQAIEAQPSDEFKDFEGI